MLANKLARRALAAAALTAALGLIIWLSVRSGQYEPHAHVRELAADFQRRTVPGGAKRRGALHTEVGARAIQATWEIETKQEWHDYRVWVIEQFGADFKSLSRSDGALVFTKQLPGDTYRVTLEKIEEKPLRVRVTFLGYPS